VRPASPHRRWISSTAGHERGRGGPILAWPGYAEDGSNDPKADWVTPFEKQTGCKATVKTFGTVGRGGHPDEDRQYDVVSASGDASLRLIAAGDVDPVNTDLIPNYADIYRSSRTAVELGERPDVRRTARLRREPADVPHRQGEAGADVVGVGVRRERAVQGQVTAYDSPIYIADARLYLMTTKPDLGIKNPYALDDKQLQPRVDLLKAAEAERRRVLVGLPQGGAVVQERQLGDRHHLAGHRQHRGRREGAGQGVLPAEGSTGGRTPGCGAKSKHPNCAYQWMNWIVSPEANAQVAEYFGEAPANIQGVRADQRQVVLRDLPRDDAAYAEKIWYWSTRSQPWPGGRAAPTSAATDYAAWSRAWTEDTRADGS
jgi:putative spermidine/putrescine transport system substrate-binding protein